MTELDRSINNALNELNNPRSESTFDLDQYIKEFRASARDKAAFVLDLLREPSFPFSGLKPVFVSIGGGDGEEIDYLLTNTNATAGVLVEMGHGLATLARERTPFLPDGKTVEVFEGDAKDKVDDAIKFAHDLVKKGKADYLVVTCHAVIHELFDRGKEKFDALAFFASIFSDVDVPTWFTYREPGVPEKWSETVLLASHCSPQSLLLLAEAIRNRQQTLHELLPSPKIIGDHVRLHKTLAMELLAKLFYLPDLAHEIEERSTAVDHTILTNTLWLAIGETAQRENRANITSFSAPTKSFISLWQSFGVRIKTLNQLSITSPLPIAESQTRLVAWRLSPPKIKVAEQNLVSELKADLGNIPQCSHLLLDLTLDALERKDFDLLNALLISKGRAWIESSEKDIAIKLLRTITSQFPKSSFTHLWCHYLLSIATLFAGEEIFVEMFPEKLGDTAEPFRLGILFKAERMEFLRKLNRGNEALLIANKILPLLDSNNFEVSSSLNRYILATCKFLLGSLLRYGGLYQDAWKLIDQAQKIFTPGVDSHDTELAHCYYAKAVCTAMTGISNFDTPFDLGSANTRQFAGALIKLSYSHAAWFLKDEIRSKQYALEAAGGFSSLGIHS